VVGRLCGHDATIAGAERGPLTPPPFAYRLLDLDTLGLALREDLAGDAEALDAGGRPRGMVIDPEALEYLPRAEVVVPGRDGSLLVPGEIMIDEEAFIQLLDQWGVGDRITIQVEGMYRAEGPVASTGVWRAPWRSFDDDEEEF
jgi:hypothetical protein